MAKLLADARAAGGYSACAWITYEDLLVAEFLRLDSRWAIAVVREEWESGKLARLCDFIGRERWREGDRTESTQLLIEYAVDHGQWGCLEILSEFDAEVAWKLLQTYALPKNVARGHRPNVFRNFAWLHLDAALTIAEAEADDNERRKLVTIVAEIWAHQRPDSVERALRELDNEILRSRVREVAAKAIASRARGESPPTKGMAIGKGSRYGTTKPKFHRRDPRSNNPDELRILDNPKDTAWLMGSRRVGVLSQAATIPYYETGRVEPVRELVAQLPGAHERSDVLHYVASYVAAYDDFESAAALLGDVGEPLHRVYATCSIVYLAARRERELRDF
jgi:hypothetical protein